MNGCRGTAGAPTGWIVAARPSNAGAVVIPAGIGSAMAPLTSAATATSVATSRTRSLFMAPESSPSRSALSQQVRENVDDEPGPPGDEARVVEAEPLPAQHRPAVGDRHVAKRDEARDDLRHVEVPQPAARAVLAQRGEGVLHHRR